MLQNAIFALISADPKADGSVASLLAVLVPNHSDSAISAFKYLLKKDEYFWVRQPFLANKSINTNFILSFHKSLIMRKSFSSSALLLTRTCVWQAFIPQHLGCAGL